MSIAAKLCEKIPNLTLNKISYKNARVGIFSQSYANSSLVLVLCLLI